MGRGAETGYARKPRLRVIHVALRDLVPRDPAEPVQKTPRLTHRVGVYNVEEVNGWRFLAWAGEV